jgi:DNA-binding response OmpR family regulator
MNRTVLIVDDDAPIRESLRKVLQAEGYEVVLAANGHEGLDQFDPARVSLLLLDLNLPAKSGWDLFERFSFLNPLLPIIIITGRQNQHELAAAAGVGALMEKPLDVPLLLQTIRRLLAESAETRLKRLVGLNKGAHTQLLDPPLNQDAGSELTNDVPGNYEAYEKQSPLSDSNAQAGPS